MKPLYPKVSLLNIASYRTLKATLLLTVSTFLISISATAQKKPKESNSSASPIWNHFDIGINGGLSFNNFVSDQPQTGSNAGYTAGALINYKAYKGLGLQLEVNALQQGGQLIRFKDDTRINLPESFQTKNVKNSSYKLNSIEIPLLVNYTFNLKQAWKPVVYAGASYAYTYNVTEHYQKTGNLLTGEDIIATVDDKQTATSYFNSNHLNLIVGASTQLPLTSKFRLLIDFRYLNGITSVRDNYSYTEKIGFGSDVRTNSFITRIGLLMPLGK